MKRLAAINGKKASGRIGEILCELFTTAPGFGVFTTMKAAGGKILFQSEHSERLLDSAGKIGLKHGFSGKQLSAFAQKALKESYAKEAIVREFILQGNSGKAIAVTTVDEPRKIPADYYEKGINAITIDAERFMPEAKSTSHFPAIYSANKAHEKGCSEAILVDREGFATEGASSNFFIVKNGKIITPREKILEGITRNRIISIAKKEFTVIGRNIVKKELYFADEMFITSSNRGIMPVARIDGKKIGNGKVGATTKKLMEKYAELLEQELARK